MSRRPAYLDVSTLLEPHWTGISVVTAEIARHLIERHGEAARFFAFDELLRRDVVEAALEINDSIGLNVLYAEGMASLGSLATLSGAELAQGSCIYPNFRRGLTRFGREILIVHDLSFAITPELHDAAATRDFRTRLYRDCREVDGVFCNSAATRGDVVSYFGIAPEKVGFAHLGASTPVSDEESLAYAAGVGRYCLVLGTLEPRKNIEMALRWIADHRSEIGALKFVFIGRDGWGPSFAELLRRHDLQDCPDILRLGFVSEPLKWAFLQKAELVVYPSLFEGFGLPVVEAMAVGAVVAAGFTSSIAELQLDDAMMFDPTNYWEFSAVLARALALGDEERAEIGARNRERSGSFRWSNFCAELEAFAARVGRGV
jgi:glycosyltransferase involved in cell wall biosynthesis